MHFRWSFGLLWLGACADQGGEVPRAPGGGTTVVDSATPTVVQPGGPTERPDGGAATGAGAEAAGGSSLPALGLPCEIQRILKDKCQTCHGDPVAGAPMPLVSWANLQAESASKAGEKIWQRMRTRIMDTEKPMPPAARPQLSASDKATLEAYLKSGAIRSDAICSVAEQADAGSGFGDDETPLSECEKTIDILAHGGQTATDTTPFVPPQGTDHYEMFWYAPTWTEKMHVVRVDPVTDNNAVLHHWLLYMKDSGSEPVGSHNPDSGRQSPDSRLLSGWAPGNKGLPLGRQIGMQVVQGPTARFGIEIHYNTIANPANRNDRSGARLCLTTKLRPKEAATHWLGTQAILLPGQGGTWDASGMCTPNRESHIIAYSPHMHLQGRYMKSVIKRTDGSTTAITDQPFAFDDQQIFPVKSQSGEIIVRPGDLIETICSYDNSKFVTFGPNTADEMCYNFVIAWPVGSLSNGSTGLVGGQNTCIDGL